MNWAHPSNYMSRFCWCLCHVAFPGIASCVEIKINVSLFCWCACFFNKNELECKLCFCFIWRVSKNDVRAIWFCLNGRKLCLNLNMIAKLLVPEMSAVYLALAVCWLTSLPHTLVNVLCFACSFIWTKGKFLWLFSAIGLFLGLYASHQDCPVDFVHHVRYMCVAYFSVGPMDSGRSFALLLVWPN